MSDEEVLGDEDLDVAVALKDVETQLRGVERELKVLAGRKRFLEKRRNQLREKMQDKETEKLKSENWGRKDFEWSDRLDAALVGVFGLETYRADQLPVMNASLSGHDALLIMPTGGGKSLTYQLPAVISQGITLVVSPLISLMEDQLIALQKIGVKAALLNANTEKEEKAEIWRELTNSSSELKLLYVTPEKCAKSKQFMSKLQKVYQMGRLSRIAIDEVHCCSQWGHDFRPDYKFLGAMKGMFPDVPVLGLTATSTALVTKDVKEILRIPGALVFLSGFNRPNLHYSVRLKAEVAADNYDQLANMLGTEFKNQSGIIYTTTTKEVETLTRELRERGRRVGAYHAQLEPVVRSRVHRSWLDGSIQAVVATVAFGMGIDKPDVRFVIHNTISKSMENFYQESGRAGRDGRPARCILQYRMSDVFKQSTMVFTEQTGLQKLYSMVGYCLNADTCRRNIIAEHFLETWEPVPCNNMCDVCEGTTVPQQEDITDHYTAAVSMLREAGSKELRVTGLKLVDALLGKGATNLKIQGWKGKLSRDKVELIVSYLMVEGFIKEDFHFTPYSTISYLVEGNRTSKNLTCNLPIFNPATKKPGGTANKEKERSEVQAKNHAKGDKKTKEVAKMETVVKGTKTKTEEKGGKRKRPLPLDSDSEGEFIPHSRTKAGNSSIVISDSE